MLEGFVGRSLQNQSVAPSVLMLRRDDCSCPFDQWIAPSVSGQSVVPSIPGRSLLTCFADRDFLLCSVAPSFPR